MSTCQSVFPGLSEGVPVIYLASMEKQTYLVRDGIRTLDMLSLGFSPNKDRFSSCRPAFTTSVGGIVASIAAFQAVVLGLIPELTFIFVLFLLGNHTHGLSVFFLIFQN